MANMFPIQWSGLALLSAFVLTWSGSCMGDFNCNFDIPGICGFTQDTTDDLDFLHHSGRTLTPGTGPSGDHTSGSGHYMYLESSGVRYGAVARLISPRFNGTVNHNSASANGVVVTFWIYMHGEELGALKVLVMNATDDNSTRLRTTMEEELSIEGEQGGEWVQKSVTVTRSSEDFHIVFEAVVGSSSRGDIAFDDVTVADTVIPTPVPTEPPAMQEFNCTFEVPGPCVFSQEQSPHDDFNVVRRGRWNNNPYAPGNDHTLGNANGIYLSVDAYNRWGYYRVTSNYQSAGDKARLISPMLAGVAEGEEPACLLFWYHMHGGNNVGEINVYIKNQTSTTLGDPVWYLRGERGQVWRAAEVRIEQPIKFQIVFEFVAGQLENMAIDDVSLSRYQCPGEHPVAREPSVDCDFDEAEICYYTHDDSGDSRWIWSNRATDSQFTGPSQDHTRGDELGFYLHIDSAYQRPKSKSRVMTPVIDAQRSASCFQFWYHMYGSHMGRLNVYAKYNNESLPETPSWTLAGNQGNQWHRGSVTVLEMSRQFVMVFEGVIGSDYRTDIAIDDVQYSRNGPCPEYTTPEPIPTTLPPGIQSDLSCDFENNDDQDNGMCGFTQATDDIMDWRRATAGTVQTEVYGYNYYRYSWGYRTRSRTPAGDHTLDSPDGSFLGVWYGYNSVLRSNDKARVFSPLLSGSENTRCLTFYLYREGYPYTFFNVFLQEYGETRTIDPAFSLYWNTHAWRRRQVEIPPSTRPFYIVFEAVVPSQYARRMIYGIDDLSLSEGRCERKQEYSGSCDFEDDLCGYYAQGSFFRNTGETPSKNTGPLADHTLADPSGHYMYLETSQPASPGDRATLYSPLLHFMGKQCIRFYVHASGNDTRRLTVSLYEPAKQKYTQLKRIEGKQPNAWMPVNVDVDVAGDYKIYFTAYVGRSYEADIAIDDITILPTPCDNHPSEMSCLFELGPDSCGFENGRQNVVDWQWYDAVFGRNYPLSSRTTESNSFMYLRSSSNSSNRQPSEFLSRRLTVDPTKTDLCLSFEYMIEGNTTQTIDVSLEEAGGKRRALDSMTDTSMAEWKIKTLSLLSPHYLRPFTVYRVVFSVSSPTNHAVTGIDNVVVSAVACSSLKNEDGYLSEGPRARTSPRRQPTGMAVGVTIFVVIVVAAIGIACFAYRGRIKLLVHRCSQQVTEMSYKSHDVAFVKDDRCDTINIPSMNESLGTEGSDGTPSISAHYPNNI